MQAITGTMGIVDSAAKVMRGLAAAGQAVVEEAMRAQADATAVRPPAAPAPPAPAAPPHGRAG
jgi:hypothetical protein